MQEHQAWILVEFMVRDVLETHWATFSYVHIEIGVIMLKFELLKLGSAQTVFSRFWVPVASSVTNYP